MPERRRGRPPHPDLLTPAEARVLEQLRRGGTNVEIAVRLGIGPETVKTHVSNMLAKLDLEDRRQLARWREPEEGAPRRRWLLAFLLRPLVAAGAVATAAIVIVVAFVLFPRADPDPDPLPLGSSLYIEGVGEVTGPVAVFVAQEIVDPATQEFRYYAFAFDPETGREWVIPGVAAEERHDIEENLDVMAVAGDRLLTWTDEDLHAVTLDGRRQLLFSSPDAAITGLVVSPDGSKVALALDPAIAYIDDQFVYPEDRIVVLDLRTGGELLRVAGDDPRLDFPWSPGELEVQRWSADGASLLASFGQSTQRHVILSLDGDLHVRHEGRGQQVRFSSDLRYAIATENRQGERFLTVTELRTGHVVFKQASEDDRSIGHVAGPFAGRYVYSTTPQGGFSFSLQFPLDAFPRIFQRADGVSVIWVDALASVNSAALHGVDLATGEVRLLSEDDEAALAEARLEERRVNSENRVGLDRCLKDVATYEACQATIKKWEAPAKWPDDIRAGRLIKWVGIVWLDR